MSITSAICLSAFGTSGFCQSTPSTENWNSFRGPAGNGVSETATPPVRWGADSSNLKWKTPIPGKASSSPIVWGDKVFLMTAVDTEKMADGQPAAKPEVESGDARRRGGGRRGGRGRGRSAPPKSVQQFWVLCLDRNDGSVVWKTKVNESVPHEGIHSTNSFCSGSPVTDGKHIFASFGSYGVFCLDMQGEVVWERQLGIMKTRNSFGEGSSPALYQDKLVVIWDHEGDSFLEVIDTTDGKTVWKKDRTDPSGWTTPLVVEHDGKVQIIINATTVRSYDMADGSLIWECGGQTGNPIPVPLVGEGFVVCMTGFRSSACYAISLDSKGDVAGSENVLWNSREIGPYVPTGVLYKDTVYATKSRGAVLMAVDAKSGKERIAPTRLGKIDSIYASMVAANDYIYVTGREGATLVIKHGTEFDVAATNELGEPVDSTPALVDNQILIRGAEHLFCFEGE